MFRYHFNNAFFRYVKWKLSNKFQSVHSVEQETETGSPKGEIKHKKKRVKNPKRHTDQCLTTFIERINQTKLNEATLNECRCRHFFCFVSTLASILSVSSKNHLMTNRSVASMDRLKNNKFTKIHHKSNGVHTHTHTQMYVQPRFRWWFFRLF